MKKQDQKINSYKVIARHLQNLSALNIDASGNAELSEALDLLSRYLAKTSPAIIEKTIRQLSIKEHNYLDTVAIDALDWDDLEKMVKSVETPRRTLEEIAIKRFGVPSGSMRSFPKVAILKEKILTLIENERAHYVIGAAAKRSAD